MNNLAIFLMRVLFMNTEKTEQDDFLSDDFLSELHAAQRSLVELAEKLGLDGDDLKKQLEADEREIREEFEPHMNMFRQIRADIQNPEYRAQHKRHCIERYFPTILFNHITRLMSVAKRGDIPRVDNLLSAVKQGGIQTIWSHIATDFTAEVKRLCGTIFSNEDVRLGAMQVPLDIQEIEEYVRLQKLKLRETPRESTGFTGFRRGFLNSTTSSARQSLNNQQDMSDAHNNSLKK